MQKKLSRFVKIRYFDKEKVWQALKKFAVGLINKDCRIEKVIVFGSIVRGQCVPGSDVDLLIILDDSGKPFLKRIPDYMPLSFPVGIDVFPYTKEEIKTMVKDNNFFLKKAMEEGIVLCERSSIK
ncbi:MAG: nucleotidyltransferase domain-containing protein [bacterium]|nr:nucleotidyltransferase domain-containing protein [bacterium]